MVKLKKENSAPLPEQKERWEEAMNEWNNPDPKIRLMLTKAKMIEHLHLIELHEKGIEAHRRSFEYLDKRYESITKEIEGDEA